jgi:hypothetical protein
MRNLRRAWWSHLSIGGGQRPALLRLDEELVHRSKGISATPLGSVQGSIDVKKAAFAP